MPSIDIQQEMLFKGAAVQSVVLVCFVSLMNEVIYKHQDQKANTHSSSLKCHIWLLYLLHVGIFTEIYC